MVKNINELAEIFSKRAQMTGVMESGTSSGSPQEAHKILESFKYSIETMAKGTEPRVGWSNPGMAALETINKKLSGEPLTQDQITNAGNDVRTNFRALDADALVQCLSQNSL